MRWTRNALGEWSGTTTTGSPNYYGDDCFGPWSWCSEYGLNGLHLLVIPAESGGCEIIDEQASTFCSAGDWRLRIRIAQDRATACGF